MNYTNQKFGMMDEGYFVPRTQIISWINSLLKLNITKIQQLGSGSIYCQIVDVIYPGKVALNKVNWKAKNDYEFIGNFKVLQGSFEKLGIKRHVEVEKLSKAKYQDNLEFIQWLKRYYDLNCGERGANYQADERRGGVEPDFSFADKTIVKNVYHGGVMLPESAVNRPRKGTVEPTKTAEKIRQKAPTTIMPKPNVPSTGSQTNIKAVISPRNKQPIVQPQPKQGAKKGNTQDFEEMLAAQRKMFEQAKQHMENRMAHQLQTMEERLMEEQLKHEHVISAYKEKLDMITELLKGKESAEEKVKLIEEIVNIDAH